MSETGIILVISLSVLFLFSTFIFLVIVCRRWLALFRGKKQKKLTDSIEIDILRYLEKADRKILLEIEDK